MIQHQKTRCQRQRRYLSRTPSLIISSMMRWGAGMLLPQECSQVPPASSAQCRHHPLPPVAKLPNLLAVLRTRPHEPSNTTKIIDHCWSVCFILSFPRSLARSSPCRCGCEVSSSSSTRGGAAAGAGPSGRSSAGASSEGTSASMALLLVLLAAGFFLAARLALLFFLAGRGAVKPSSQA